MRLNFKYIGILLTVMAVTISCSKQEDIQTDSHKKLTLADLDVSIDAHMSDYTDGNNPASRYSQNNSRATSATWTDGAEIAFALDGSATPTGKLKYDALTGKWNKSEVDNEVTVKAEGGKVCALHARELTIDTKADGAQCSGNLVYTEAGTYKVADGVIYFTMHLDKMVESRLVISGVAAKAKVLNIKNKRLKSFADMTFAEEDGTGEGTYDEKSKTLTVEGCLPDDGSGKTTLKIQYLDGDKKGHLMTRIYEKKAGFGQSIDISGPDTDGQADEWTDAGLMPTSVFLRNPLTDDEFKDGQELVSPLKSIFAEVVILPEDVADKSFTVSCNPQYGANRVIAKREELYNNNLLASDIGTTTLTVTTCNGLKTTLKLEVIEQKSIKVNGLRYNFIPGNALELVQPDIDGKYGTPEPPYSGDIVIPESVDYEGKTYPVTSIGNAFNGNNGNKEVTSITIGDNVINIKSLWNIPNLKKLKIGKRLKKKVFDPAENTFILACENLTTIEVDPGNKYFTAENGVLYGRIDLSQEIHHYCVYVCQGYTEPVYINNNTKEILPSSIYNVQTSFISIPRSVTNLGKNLFGGEKTKLMTIKLNWSFNEWRGIKIGGVYLCAHIKPEDYYFYAHPDIKNVIIDVPDEDVEQYGYLTTWSYAIEDPKNSSGRIR